MGPTSAGYWSREDWIRHVSLGKPKHGKSWLARVIASDLHHHRVRWTLIHDVIREPQYLSPFAFAPDGTLRETPPRPLLHTIKDVARYPTEKWFTFRYPVKPGEVAMLAGHLRARYPQAEVTLIFDELDQEGITNNGKWDDPRVHDAFHFGRGIHIIATTQRPVGMPTGIRAMVDKYHIFNLHTKADLDRLRDDRIPESFIRKIPQLPPKHFITADFTVMG